MNKKFSWYFAITSVAYVPIACDVAMKLTANESIGYWLLMCVAFAVCALIFLMAYNTNVVMEYYPQGASTFALAKENLNKYFAVVAAAGAMVDYLLTTVIMAIYFAYILEGLFAFTGLTVSITCAILFIVAVLSYLKVRIHIKFIKFFTIIFFILLFGLIGIVIYRNYNNLLNIPDFCLFNKPKDTIMKIFITLKLFSYLTICSIGFDSIRFKSSFQNESHERVGVYRTAIIVSLIMVSVLMFAQYLNINPTHTNNTLFQIMTTATKKQIFPLMTLIFISIVMFVATCSGFALLPEFARELAMDKFFPTLFKNSKDSFMFAQGIIITFILTCIITFISKGEIKILLEIYCIGAFISIGIGQLAMFKKIEKPLPKYMSFLGAVISLLIVVMFCLAKFNSGAWIVLIAIFALSMFMLDLKRYYTGVDSDLELDSNKTLGVYGSKNTSIVIIADMDLGIVPAVKYAYSISPDSRAVYVSSNLDETNIMEEEWEKYFPEIPLVILKNDKNDNVIKPIMKYIDLSRKNQVNGLITVVVPEYVPRAPFYMLFHRNYAFILRVLLGFKKGIITVSVPYFSNSKYRMRSSK